MKRKLAAAILGIAASVGLATSAHAQGFVTFGNYNSSAPVNYGAGTGGPVGTGVNSSYTAGLWYFLGTTSLASAGGNASQLPAGWEAATVAAQFNVGQFAGPAGVGFFSGTGANSTATIADYTSGPITFSVISYDGSSFASANNRGNSAGFTLPSITTGNGAVGEFGPGLTSFSVLPVPEPSIFALSGLAGAALMLIRRKK